MNSEIFQKEIACFEGKATGVVEFTSAVLDSLPTTFAGTEYKPSGIAIHTKCAFAFAEQLLSLEHNHMLFQMSERDEIRCAVLLHDGFKLGAGSGNTEDPSHPVIMANYIRNERWKDLFPECLRDEIAAAIETHSGQWNVNGNESLRKPETPMEEFVHDVVHLASKKSTTIDLPGVASYYNRSKKGDFLDAMAVVREMTDGRSWDGIVYAEQGFYYVYIDRQRVPVPKALYSAYVTIGEAHKRNYRSASQESVFSYYDFVKQFPGWDGRVYGNPGEFYIQFARGTVKISNIQAQNLGIKVV